MYLNIVDEIMHKEMALWNR